MEYHIGTQTVTTESVPPQLIITTSL